MAKTIEKEIRCIRDSRMEVRSAEGAGAPSVITGYAAVFHSLSEDLGGFRERILPGAFKASLEENADIRALWNHDSNYVLGRTPNTLSLWEDEIGLRFEVTPPDTQWARDLMESIGRGDVTQTSFRFITRKDQFIHGEDDIIYRELVELELIEVSPVTFPAYQATNVQLRGEGVRVMDYRAELQRLGNLRRWAGRK